MNSNILRFEIFLRELEMKTEMKKEKIIIIGNMFFFLETYQNIAHLLGQIQINLATFEKRRMGGGSANYEAGKLFISTFYTSLFMSTTFYQ